jgi:sec-independent protein translocase protein TatA
MGNIGPMELAVVLIIALLVFGPKKLPEIGRGVGQAMREFKKASRDIMSSFNDDYDERPRPAAASASDTDLSATLEPACSHQAWTERSPTDPESGKAEELPAHEPIPAGVIAAAPSGELSSGTGSAPSVQGRDTAHQPERTT